MVYARPLLAFAFILAAFAATHQAALADPSPCTITPDGSGGWIVVCASNPPSVISPISQTFNGSPDPADSGHVGTVVVSPGDGDNGNPGGSPTLDFFSIGSMNQAIEDNPGTASAGLFIQSKGANGGNGGDADVCACGGGNGGSGGAGGNPTVTIEPNLTILTNGSHEAGVFVQSAGGNGGDGGSGNGAASAGNGGVGGVGGSVTLTLFSTVVTVGDFSDAVIAQSIGGGGGNGGGGLNFSGGSGGPSENGGDVTVNLGATGGGEPGAIFTFGTQSVGLLAQSIGGYGGVGGSSFGLVSVSGGGGNGGNGGTVNVTTSFDSSIITQGNGSTGLIAQSIGGAGGNGGDGGALFAFAGSGSVGGNGGDVTVRNGATITTNGGGAQGLLAQSIGGGGGNGGTGVGVLALGGSGSSTSPGGNVSIFNTGNITTNSTSASSGGSNPTFGDEAIFAQSIGGGGGNGGTAVGAFTVGGSGGGGGDGGSVSVNNNATLITNASDSSGIFAQSVGGGGGNGGGSVGAGAFLSLSIGGDAGIGGNGSTTSVTSGGSITTNGDRSNGIQAQSIGGGGGNGGFAIDAAGGQVGFAIGIGGTGGGGGNGGTVNVSSSTATTTNGNDANGILAQSIGGGGGNGGFAIAASGGIGAASFALGGSGGNGGTGGDVSVSNFALGKISTTSENANGILAQSIGGGGGNGGFSVSAAVGAASAGLSVGGEGSGGGDSGTVSLTNHAIVSTTGSNSDALLAQSLGGGGGSGGFSVGASLSLDAGAGLSIGGGAADGGNGGAVTFDNSGALTTTGEESSGLSAQSIGGGGGDGGFSVAGGLSLGPAASFGIGGFAGGGGNGGTVSVTNSGAITTFGSKADALSAQSVGGGGGNGGWSVAGSFGAESGAISIGVGGFGGDGGNGDTVNVLNGTLQSPNSIFTYGSNANGIDAKSLGGGGGNGGWSVAGSITGGASLSLDLGGFGGGGGNGGEVDVANTSSITTGVSGAADYSNGILAQSIGGGGGSGGFSVAGTLSEGIAGDFNLGGTGGSGGDSGNVSVTNAGLLSTNGNFASGINAQSIGGGGGAGGFAFAGALANSSSATLGLGGNGGTAGNAGTVSVTNLNNITTLGGSYANGILAQSIGGGGGLGGWSAAFGVSGSGVQLSDSFGGNGGGAGSGNTVTVNSGAAGAPVTIVTHGAASDGILAQSIGGGGGDGGITVNVSATGDGDGEPDNAKYAMQAINLGYGIFSSAVCPKCPGSSGGDANNGGDVNVTSYSNITTHGDHSSAIAAQSIGGGGGAGAMSVGGAIDKTGPSDQIQFGSGGGGGNGGIVTLFSSGTLVTDGSNADAILAQSIGGGGGFGGLSGTNGLIGDGVGKLGLSFGQSGDQGGDGGKVTVTNASSISTDRANSNGIVAQSIGGGGGNGGFAIQGGFSLEPGTPNSIFNYALGSFGGAGGNGGTVSVNSSGAIVQTLGARSDGILAESIGGGGGNGGFAINGAYTPGWAMGFSVGGSGGSSGNGGQVNVTNASQISTSGDLSNGISAQSIGGGGGNGGFAFEGLGTTGFTATLAVGGSSAGGGNGNEVNVFNSGAIGTLGESADAILAQSIGGGGGNGGAAIAGAITPGSAGTVLSFGASGGAGGFGSDVNVTNEGQLITQGDNSADIAAQSIGGGGGNGGFSIGAGLTGGKTLNLSFGGNGGNGGSSSQVTVSNSAPLLMTSGNNAYGILAQSIGGGGGNGGFTVGATAALGKYNLGLSFGGNGGTGGTGGVVSVNNGSLTGPVKIVTSGTFSDGILAQSIGGGGGSGGWTVDGLGDAGASLAFSLGGSGGSGNDAKNVIVNNAGGTIQTSGMGANGIVVQAIGGGGGSGGFNESGQLDIASAGVTAQSKFNFGNGGGGGNGANVEVSNTGQVFTSGENAVGVLAQSVGGGGGYGGFGYGTALLGQWGIGLGSSTAGGGAGAAVTIENDGTIGTTGNNAAGVIAQSIGGGGGDGGFAWSAGLNTNISSPTANVGWALGGNGGNGGNGGLVTVTNNGVISTSGANSAGVIAQSIGGGGGNGGNATTGLASLTKYFEGFNLALGGNAGTTGSGGTVTVTNTGLIQTTGAFSDGVIAQSIGGGGGNGGNATSLIAIAGLDESLAYGGAGGSGGAGGNVTLNNSGTISTTGFGSAPIVAQSIGGGGGTGGSMVSGSPITGGLFGFKLGGSNGGTGASGTVTINNTGTLASSGMFSGDLLVQSVGGGGGIASSALLDSLSTKMNGQMLLGATGGTPGGGTAISGTNGGQLTTTALGADAMVVQSVGGGGGIGGSDIALNMTDTTIGGLLFGERGVSAPAGNGAAATLSDNAVAATSGDAADALLAQSISAGGGVGTFAVGGTFSGPSLLLNEGTTITDLGSADNVNFTTSSNAQLQTLGFHSAAAAAQSIAGGGGTGTILIGGNISGTSKIGYTLGATGTGTATTGGTGATVTVSNSAQKIVTQGDLSSGLIAQSIAGGGGDAAFKLGGTISNAALSGVLGGSQLTAGTGGAVNVTNNGFIGASGNGSLGMLAQSIGGGGGIGGFDTIAGTLPSVTYSMGGTNDSGTLGGTMQLTNTGQIVTTGIGDAAAVAQSIGGGGGEAGYALNLNLGTAATTLNLVAGGNGGSNDLGGAVTLANSAQIGTGAADAIDLLAQSIGGGGGNGGMFAGGKLTTSGSANQFNLQLGGSGGTGNDAGAVQLTSTIVTSPSTAAYIANGDRSAALVGQSIGGGGGNESLTFNGAFSTGTPNTALVQIGGTKSGNGNTVTMNNTGSIATGLHTSPGVIEGAFSYGLLAQSIGGGGGNGVLAMDLGVPTSGTSSVGTINVNVGGKTGGNGNGAAVNVTDSDKIQTIGAEATGIVAQSIGGGGGNGAAVIVGNKTAPPPVQAQYKLNIDVGGTGSTGNGGNVTVTHSGGAIVTQGNEAQAILAQSIGGGGGNGGPVRSIIESHPTQCFTAIPPCSARLVGATVTLGGNGSSGSGGTVTVNNTANLGTGGEDASGIVAQSIGGGGGIAGDAHAGHGDWDITPNDVPGGTLKNWSINLGGLHSTGNGGNVSVTDSGSITTQGDGSFGIIAQSIGGGGGFGGEGLGPQYGGAGTIVAGGAATSSGNGGSVNVTVNNGPGGTTSILTQGNGAYGIFAQSVGGGGGLLGETGNGIGKTVIGKGSKQVSSTGNGGSGGAVTVVNNGSIKTTGTGSEGIFAQSIGGGGGLLPGYAGTAALGGAAGAVSVTQNGVINTAGNNSDAIFAQSAGGKGLAGNVTVNLTGMALAFGATADGITAQSNGNQGNGNISITVNTNSVVQGGTGTGSAGVRILGGKNNTLINHGTITTASAPSAQPQPMSIYETAGGIMGVQQAAGGSYQSTSLMTDKTSLLSTFTGSTAYSAGTAVYANTGTLNLNNQGKIYGSMALGGANLNFNNSGTYVSGSSVNLGTGTLSLASGGVMTPGAGGFIASTDIIGNFVQSAGADYLVNLDLSKTVASLLNVSGTASLGGSIDLDLLSTNAAAPGAHTDTIVTAGSGLTNNGVALTPPKSAVATFNLGYLPDALLLNYAIDYAPQSGRVLNSNDLSFGNYIGAIQSAGSSARLASFMSDVFGIPTIPKLKNFYDRFTPAATPVLSSSTLLSNLQFSDEMLRCRAEGLVTEGGNCSWARLGAQSSHETASFASAGYGASTSGIAAGFEHRIGTGNTLLGAAIHYSRDALFDGDNATNLSGNGLEAGISASRIFKSGVVLSADFLAGQGHYDSVRQLSYPSELTRASGTQAISYLGTHLRAEQRFGGEIKAATPFVDFGLTRVNVGSLFESGAGTFNAQVAPYHTNYPTLTGGVRLEDSRHLRSTVLHGALDLWMTQIVGNPQASTTAVLAGAPAGVAPFTVSNTLDRTQFDIGPSLEISRGGKASVRVGATYNFSRHNHSGGAYIEVGTKI